MSQFQLSQSKLMHPVVYTIVVNRYATLKELTYDYTIEEALALYEACLVNMYNKHQAMSGVKGGQK